MDTTATGGSDGEFAAFVHEAADLAGGWLRFARAHPADRNSRQEVVILGPKFLDLITSYGAEFTTH